MPSFAGVFMWLVGESKTFVFVIMIISGVKCYMKGSYGKMAASFIAAAIMLLVIAQPELIPTAIGKVFSMFFGG